MKAYDFDAVTYDASVYCVECLPDGITVDSEDVSPIFADSEWDYAPVCDACGAVHDYVTVLTNPDEDEPSEPDEDDLTTTDHRTFYQSGRVAFEVAETVDGTYMLLINGFQVGGEVDRSGAGNATYPTVEAVIRAYMDRVQFWPNVWFISDHGNAHLMDLTEDK